MCCKLLKCPAKILCCCCECACNMVLGLIGSALVILVLIGVIVYFAVYHNKDTGVSNQEKQMAARLIREVPHTFRDYFNH